VVEGKHMEHWGSLVQTVLWVGLIGGAIIWAHKPLHGILTALQKRIEAGSEIAAGPFSLKDLKPQPAEQQVEKAKAEVIQAPTEPAQIPSPAGPAPQVASTHAPEVSAPIQLPAPNGMTQQAAAKKVIDLVAELNELKKTLVRITANTSQSQAYLAEDLAMRTIQTEFNTPVRRQVTGGRDGGFDGVFESKGQVQIVEVKYIGTRASPGETAARIKESMLRIQRDASKYGWTSSEIILAAVFANAEVPPEHQRAIEAMCREVGGVTPRFYTLGKLKRQWGMDSEDWDDKIYR
jgi:hypothetical protein